MAKSPSRKFFVLVHNIRSLLNVGSIFRSADALGVDKLFLSGYTGRPDHPFHGAKIEKTALGAEKFVPWEYSRSAAVTIRKLKKLHPEIAIVGLENNITVGEAPEPLLKLPAFKPSFPLLLILGEEVAGINKNVLKLCDHVVEIPMQGQKESLNVSVAFGIAAFWIRK